MVYDYSPNSVISIHRQIRLISVIISNLNKTKYF